MPKKKNDNYIIEKGKSQEHDMLLGIKCCQREMFGIYIYIYITNLDTKA